MNKQLPLFGALVLASSSVLAHQQWQDVALLSQMQLSSAGS